MAERREHPTLTSTMPIAGLGVVFIILGLLWHFLGGEQGVDASVLEWFVSQRDQYLDGPMVGYTLMGNILTTAIMTSILVIALLISGRKRTSLGDRNWHVHSGHHP